MSRDQQRLADYLAHIREAIERIGLYTKNMTETSFMENKLVQDAVVRNLEILGEASNNIEKHHPEFAAGHPELPLTSAYQMRNAVAHGYFKVDFGIVWKTIQSELPALDTQIRDVQTVLQRSAESGD